MPSEGRLRLARVVAVTVPAHVLLGRRVADAADTHLVCVFVCSPWASLGRSINGTVRLGRWLWHAHAVRLVASAVVTLAWQQYSSRACLSISLSSLITCVT